MKNAGNTVSETLPILRQQLANPRFQVPHPRGSADAPMLGRLFSLDLFRDRVPRDPQPLSDFPLRHALIQMKTTNQSPHFHRNHPSIVLGWLSFHRRFWLNL